MSKMRISVYQVFAVCLLMVMLPTPAGMPNQVAHLSVTAPGVDVRRVNTAAWFPIKFESLVGTGDAIRTGDKGQATITVFGGLLTVTLSPRSELTLDTLNGQADAFSYVVTIRQGLVTLTTQRMLKEAMHFAFTTPGLAGSLQLGEVNLLVIANGRSEALVLKPGQTLVSAANSTDASSKNAVSLTIDQGVRGDRGVALSDVVPAKSFPTLDSALDGCPSVLTLSGDVQLNVRLGGSLDFARVGGLDTNTALRVMGVTSDGWYRIRYLQGFAWINIAKLPLDARCMGLRPFPNKYGPENAELINTPPTPIPKTF